MSTAAPAFIALGFSDLEVCAHCGRQNLRRTVLIAPVDADGAVTAEPVPYGVVCASNATGRTSTALVNEAASAETSAAARRREVAEFVEGLGDVRPTRAARLLLARAHRAGAAHWISPLLRAEAVALIGEDRAADIAADIAA